ncbi:MAG: nucleoside kinase [Oscillospiraceae bacterium]|nr:nucleoside kinase [Oscillospiraceae bacterium]
MSYDIEWINKRIHEDPKGFIEDCDLHFANRISIAADAICKNLDKSPIVLMAGPSGSGKTTTAQKLVQELEKRGIKSHSISMDNYFNTIDPRTMPRTPEGEMDFESPLCLDMDLLSEHFSILSEGGEIRIPYYMFARQKRSASRFFRMRLEKNEIAIFEGIHALNDSITEPHPEAFPLYISVASDILLNGEILFKREWIRLVRRVVRDSKFRGSSAKFTLELWGNIMRGEENYIVPYMHKARATIDSSLPYELPIMESFAMPLFRDIPEDALRMEELQKILPAFDYVDELDAELGDSLLADDSLLREFIGGGIYKY